MLLIGFTGIFAVTALRKIFIIDYKLAYPSGTATGVLINSLHTPAGEKRVSDLLASLFLHLLLRLPFFSFLVLVSLLTVPVCRAQQVQSGLMLSCNGCAPFLQPVLPFKFSQVLRTQLSAGTSERPC